MKLDDEDRELLVELVEWFELVARPWMFHDVACWFLLRDEGLVQLDAWVQPTERGIAFVRSLPGRHRPGKPILIDRPGYKCERCGHEWRARASKTGRPKFCAKCHSIRWDVVE